MKNNLQFLLIVSIALVSITSCTFVSQSMKSDEERISDLEIMVEKISKIYSWKSYNELAKYIDGNPSNIIRDLNRKYKEIRISEVNVDRIDTESKADAQDEEKAYSILEVKSFTVPKNILETHYDQIEWVFKASEDGWRIKKIDMGKANSKE